MISRSGEWVISKCNPLQSGLRLPGVSITLTSVISPPGAQIPVAARLVGMTGPGKMRMKQTKTKEYCYGNIKS
jgi:hypothetical protein